MPRPKSIVWKFFKEVQDANNKVAYKCNYYGELYVNNATRQRNHLKTKCVKCPQTVKEMLRKEIINSKQQQNHESAGGNNDSNGNDILFHFYLAFQVKLDPYTASPNHKHFKSLLFLIICIHVIYSIG